MELNFCTQCGNPLTLKEIGDEGLAKYCPECNRYFFDNPAVCVLVTIVNEKHQVLLLKQNYITTEKWTLCSGYLKKGDTLEETVIREVLEETGQEVVKCQYVTSYYFEPKNLIMAGFIAYVNSQKFSNSNEVDALKWVNIKEASAMLARENNFSGIHFDNCYSLIYG